jgi:glycosyltransferase involved in cell wall biosynthesis
MKKTRLFVDAHIFDDPLQGTRTYLKELYIELIHLNHSVNFFFGAFDAQQLKREFGEHENVRFIKFNSRNKFLRLIFIIPFIIIKYKIDISHFQYISPLFRFSKEILTTHDILFMDFADLFPYSYRKLNKFLFRRSARRADYLLTVSDYSRNRIAEHFMIKEENIHVITNGVNIDFFDPVGELPDVKSKFNLDKYILYVSRIEPRKNHLLLLKAFVEIGLWKDGIKLVFIGSKTLPTPLFESYLEKLPEKIRSSVLLINESYGNELKSFYRNSSLFVYPSLAEGFGIPPLEAIASGVPVLCSNSTAMSDFNFLHEWQFSPYSVEELKEKIIKSLYSETWDIIDAQEYIKQNYNWKNSADRFADIIFHG